MTNPSSADFASHPLSARQMMRLGAALMPYGLPYRGTVWVAMRPDEPNDVLGVAPTRAECEALIARAAPANLTYLSYGPITAPPAADAAMYDRDDPSFHDFTDMGKALRVEDCENPDGPHSHAEAIEVRLTIVWRKSPDGPKSRCTYVFPGHTDAIWLTRGAREAFAYPRYLSLFGQQHVDALRAKLGDTASGTAT